MYRVIMIPMHTATYLRPSPRAAPPRACAAHLNAAPPQHPAWLALPCAGAATLDAARASAATLAPPPATDRAPARKPPRKTPRRSGRRLKNRSDAGLLAELCRVAGLIEGGALRRAAFDRVSLINSDAIGRRFGGWGAALAKAGLAHRYGGMVVTQGMRTKPARGLTDRQLLDRLRRAARRDGVVTQQAVRRKFGHYCDAYTGRFGSWRAAVWKAGLRLAPNAACDRRRKRTPEEKHKVSDRLRYAILKRDDYRCQLCGDSPAITRGTILEVDHIHPFSQGGKTTEDNLRTLCRRCNQGKGAGV